jgi:hypothetical protein
MVILMVIKPNVGGQGLAGFCVYYIGYPGANYHFSAFSALSLGCYEAIVANIVCRRSTLYNLDAIGSGSTSSDVHFGCCDSCPS